MRRALARLARDVASRRSSDARAVAPRRATRGNHDGDARGCCDAAATSPPRFTSTHEIVNCAHAHGARSTYTVGMSAYAFELIGDATRVEPTRASGETVTKGETLARVHWSGFTRTAGDELYHSRWANASGTREIAAPFDVKVVRYNMEALRDPYMNVRGPETWLAEVEAESGSTATLMDEEDYDALVEREEMAAADKANAAYP
jgi:glycine cleavage system H lipoate-binding protein